MKKLKTMFITFIALIFIGLGMSFSKAQTVHAASFSKYITHHTWIMETDGFQGGFNGKTKFTKRNIIVNDSKQQLNINWEFSSIKMTNKNTYFVNAKQSTNYSGSKNSTKSSYMIKLKSKNTIWIVPKHFNHVQGNYKGNDQFGAFIFKLKK